MTTQKFSTSSRPPIPWARSSPSRRRLRPAGQAREPARKAEPGTIAPAHPLAGPLTGLETEPRLKNLVRAQDRINTAPAFSSTTDRLGLETHLTSFRAGSLRELGRSKPDPTQMTSRSRPAILRGRPLTRLGRFPRSGWRPTSPFHARDPLCCDVHNHA
jgi:hypothetical protein